MYCFPVASRALVSFASTLRSTSILSMKIINTSLVTDWQYQRVTEFSEIFVCFNLLSLLKTDKKVRENQLHMGNKITLRI